MDYKLVHYSTSLSATYLGILYHFVAKISQKTAPKGGCTKGLKYMIIKKINIEKFRDIHNTEFVLGKYITAIAGRNGSMKSTLLGIIGQTFTIPKTGHPLSGIKTIDGFAFKSQFSEKFRFSSHEKAKDHAWTTYFYKNIYKDDYFSCESMYRDKSRKLRFWNAKGRNAGTGYPNIPVYFLSLSRLAPIGEVKKFKRSTPQLSPEEETFFISNHKEILSNNYASNVSVSMRDSTKKLFSGLETSSYDVNSNSAGEDNVGKIILSILSFKRIQEQHPADYHGGILLIDELDATLYPYAQRKLVKFLYKQAQECKLQIVFTTHSPYTLKSVLSINEYKNQSEAQNEHIMPNRSLLYLHRDFDDANNIYYIDIQTVSKKSHLRRCLQDIQLEPYIPSSVNVYFEDNVGMRFFTYLVKDKYLSFLTPIDINLGWTNYISLHQHNIPEFKTNSLIVLDHDVREKLTEEQNTYISATNNIIFLPDDVEKGFYKMLRNRSNYNYFKKITDLQFDVCFRDYIDDSLDSKQAKHWYSDVLKMINNNEQAFYDTWIHLHQDKFSIFIEEFKKAYNALAKELDLDEIID